MALKQIFHAKPLPLCPPTGLQHKSCLAAWKKKGTVKACLRPYALYFVALCSEELLAGSCLIAEVVGGLKSLAFSLVTPPPLLHAVNPTLLRVATNSTVDRFEKDGLSVTLLENLSTVTGNESRIAGLAPQP